MIMRTDIDAYIDDRFNAYCLSAKRDVPAREAFDALLPGVMSEIEASPRDVEGEARRLLESRLEKNRDSGRSYLKKHLAWMVAALTDPDSTIAPDVMLDMAFPLGKADGASQSLRYWKVEDLQSAAMSRFRQAAEQTSSASEFDQEAQKLIDLMNDNKATEVGDLFQ